MSRVFFQDLRYARRMLRKNRALAVTAVVTLMLAVAAVAQSATRRLLYISSTYR
jgi:hypothetical protein